MMMYVCMNGNDVCMYVCMMYACIDDNDLSINDDDDDANDVYLPSFSCCSALPRGLQQPIRMFGS